MWKVDDHNLNMFLSPFFYSWLLCPTHALIKPITSAVEAFSCLHNQAKPSLHHNSNITWGYKTARRYFNFCLGYFLSSKTFHHHPKKRNASIFHLKSDRNNGFSSRSLNSPPSEHTSHSHCPLVASNSQWSKVTHYHFLAYEIYITDSNSTWVLSLCTSTSSGGV